MPGNLDFSSLIPEHATFTLPDGAKLEFVMKTEFGASIAARFFKAHEKFTEARKGFKADASDVQSADAMEESMRDMLKIILPALPGEIAEKLTMGQEMAILDFWIRENGLDQPPAPDGHEEGESVEMDPAEAKKSQAN